MAENKEIRIWDIWIRLFHWTFAGSILFQFINGNTGWQFYDWHRQIGEFVLALVLFRLLWAVLGSSNASLTRLITGPKAVLSHLGHLFRKTVHPERGHNAAGGWAVLFMLLLVTVQAVTGLFIADEDEYIEGALYGNLSGGTTDLMYEIHEFNAGVLQLIVAVHVLMVLVYWLYARQNLIVPMLKGSMKWTADSEPPRVTFQAFWKGAVLLALSFAAVGFAVGWY